MADWMDLENELEAWATAGQTATFWWRDDDAKSVTPELDKLLELRRRVAVPLALAVIPAGADDALARLLAPLAEITVLQHGYAHRNHASEGEKKSELGAGRPLEQILGELIAGRDLLEALFSRRMLPVLVPPWNRIDAALVPELAGRGFTGLSSWGPRAAPLAGGLAQVNSHVDIIDWPGSRGFVGQDVAIGQVIDHLQARRAGTADAAEPTGLLTHHLAHDPAAWSFIPDFITRTKAHPAARWLSALELFPRPAA